MRVVTVDLVRRAVVRCETTAARACTTNRGPAPCCILVNHAAESIDMITDLAHAWLTCSAPVAAAQAAGRPLVALESTIIAHGMPYPENVRTAREVEALIRDVGAEPATIALVGGRIHIGLTDDELELLGRSD